MNDIDSLQERLYKAEAARNAADERVRKAKAKLDQARLGDYPTEPGWYEDANGNIARLIVEHGRHIWDDGWGFCEEAYQLPPLPLTRLVRVNE